jgi:hypothetical protein
MPAGESASHARLKVLALAWAQANGLPIAAAEVRMPRSGYRVDVAACARGPSGRTAVFECKQARSDLLKDSHPEQATRLRLAELVQRRAALEALMSTHRPDLRRGESLFPEFDALDFSGLEHRTYRGVLARIGTLQARMLRGTKFSRMVRYRCADLLYLVSEEGIFAPAEIPAGWGLLVRVGDQLVLERPPAALDSAPEQRCALLESIALAGTRAVNRAAGISVAVVEQPDGWARVVQVPTRAGS